MQNKVTARKRANTFLAEWRAKHTRAGEEPPYDSEFEDLTESWPECWGYLVNRPHEKELHDIFADAFYTEKQMQAKGEPRPDWT